MRRSFAFPLAFALVLSPSVLACGGDDDDGNTDDGNTDDGGNPCGEIDGACIELSPSDDDQTAVQTALIDAQPGDVILMHAGTYVFDTGLSLDVDGVSLVGEGDDQTILSFLGQTDGAEGLLVTADDFTMEDIGVEDTAGDAVKVEGGARIVFRGVRTEWTGDQTDANGAYGLYPVQCSDVLIEDSIVRGASDAGIYVGQSERAVVRGNTVEGNVAGIEIENTFDADVYDNTATNNTGGILVFNLPGLDVPDGGRTRVYNNMIIENNGENFATPGSTVSQVPPGTGFVALAAHDVEIFDNTISGNVTSQASVISFQLTATDITDDIYVPYSDTIWFHDNTFDGGGDDPQGLLGAVLAGVVDLLSLDAVPDIVVDGNFDPALVDVDGFLPPELNICLSNNDGADFLDLGFVCDSDLASDCLPIITGGLAPATDDKPYLCEHDPLPEVVLDGVPL
ncbi:MAG TPA: parallel beta-helix domain-containing protein [Kofleriaceae bacterium]|nr:parallel beta-helix domain-containing protein [Kofleriaceae bacterium]